MMLPKWQSIIVLLSILTAYLHSQESEESGTIEKEAYLETLMEFPGPYIKRPGNITYKFQPNVITYKEDGLDGMHLLLEGDGLDLKIPVLKQWLHGVSNAAGYSVLFTHRVANTIKFGITLISKEDFLPLLEKQFLTIYLASLMNDYRNLFVFNNPDLSLRPKGHLAYLLSGEAYYVDYTLLEQPRIRPEAQRYIQYYVELPEGILELSLSGPSDQLEGFKSEFHSILTNLSIDTPEID